MFGDGGGHLAGGGQHLAGVLVEHGDVLEQERDGSVSLGTVA